MTIHEALISPARQPLMTVLFLLLTVQMALLIASYRESRKHSLRLAYMLHFLLTFLFFYMPKYDIDWVRRFPDRADMAPPVLASFRALPVAVMIVYELLTALIILCAFLELIRFRKNHPTFGSIKETMDMLPVGIAFGKPDGTVVLSNLAMNTVSRALTGRALTDLSAFRNVIREKSTGGSEDDPQVTLPQGTVLQISAEDTQLGQTVYTQLSAADITEQAAITRELSEKNKKLRDMHMRLDIYNKQAERIIIAQELLTARMAVHNELGSILLESRHYLNDPSTINEEILLQALKSTNTYLLREYEQDDTSRTPLAEALEIAEAIGVNVEISGVPPTADTPRGILAAAITECATNAVKHANGDALSVSIVDTAHGMVFTLQTNGLPPKTQITESGGLLSLRALVEKSNGTMKLENRPQVKLTISLLKAD